MTIADAAHIAEVSERTIRTWVADGRVRSELVDNRRYVDQRQVSALSLTRKRAGSARPPWEKLAACFERVC